MNPLDARFCGGCGTALPRRGDAVVARKVVTIVFADLAGSTALHERLDAESVRRVMDDYHRVLHAATAAHGGTVVKRLGDGIMAAFGVPRVAADDALRAVRAAVAMQEAFRTLAAERAAMLGGVTLRVGVNTGEVVVEEGDADLVGDPVNVAARLEHEAAPGDVLVGEETRRLLADVVTLAPVGRLALRGRTEAVPTYRVVSLERPPGARVLAFVGREDELRRLAAVSSAAIAARTARMVVVIGSPGLGKTRLVREHVRRLGDTVTVVSTQCEATGGATFAPLAGALRATLELDAGETDVGAAIGRRLAAGAPETPRVAAGVAALLGGTPPPAEETFFVVRRLLAAMAASRPVLVFVDDLQWAAPPLLDLLEHLVTWSSDVPLVVVAAARPELRDLRPTLTSRGGVVADVVTLGGLDAVAAGRLAANAAGADELPEAVAGRVLATSDGNPLFLGELVRMLVHDGTLRRDGAHWTATVELSTLEMPPTIHALLAARIEGLGPEECSVLERAAIVGRHFSRAAVAHLLPHVDDLDARLDSLRRSELIEPDTGSFLGEPALRFHHVLVRDAAYRRVLKGERAALHGRFAEWAEARAGGAVELEEMLGWHVEQAHRLLGELGPLDASGRAFGERAACHLAAAGRRALERDDLGRAANLLERALECLEQSDAARAELALDWCEALLSAGTVGPAARALAELARFVSGSSRLAAWHTCLAGQLAVLIDPAAPRETAPAAAAAARVLATLGDLAGEAKAHAVHAAALERMGALGASEAALDRALAAARRAGDRRRANAVLAGVPIAALWGPSPVTRASGCCLDVVRVLRITRGGPAVEAVAVRVQAVLEALRGRSEAAHRLLASSRAMVEELGLTQQLLEVEMIAGFIQLLDGDLVAAEGSLRGAYRGLRDQGLGIDAAHAAALLGRVLLEQGRAGEAEAVSAEIEALAGDDLQTAVAWRRVRAEALARRGEHVAGIALARAAVELAAATDALLDHADARRALAAALRAAGRHAEADAEDARALQLWEEKGATRLVEQARQRRGAGGGEAPRIEGGVDDGGPVGTDWARFANGATRWLAAHPTAGSHRHGTLLATRGHRLALVSMRRHDGDDDAGPDGLELIEVDEHGLLRARIGFDADQEDEARAELDARFIAGEAAPFPDVVAGMLAFQRAYATQSWDALASCLAPDLMVYDQRRLGWDTMYGPETYVGGLRAMAELAPDARIRLDHVVLRAAGYLVVASWVGTHEGGSFETPNLLVIKLDHMGRIQRMHQYELDRLDEAFARLDGAAQGVPGEG